VEAKTGKIGTATQSGSQVSYGGIICHWSVWSKGFGTLGFRYFFKDIELGQ